jgi:cholesterol transport system auxiliary component
MTQLARRTLLLALPAALAACSSILPSGGPAPQLFTLTPATDFPPGLASAKAQLLVDEPVVTTGLDTERIALMRGPTMIDYFAGASWTDRAPVMTQGLIVESFENSGKIAAVARESLALRADFILEPELRDFAAHYEGADGIPTIRVRLGAKLVHLPDRQIVAERSFEAAQPAAQDSEPAVVDAFDTAFRGVLRDLVAWALPTIAGK